MARIWFFPFLFAILASAGCSQHEEGLSPVGGAVVPVASRARYVRRLYLDLTGAPPGDAVQAAALDRLSGAGAGAGGAATRGALADELLRAPAFARSFVSELENRLFTGQQRMALYDQLCRVVRLTDPACSTCAPAGAGEACTGCACPIIAQLTAEQKSLGTAADDLAAGAGTAEIERRYAQALIYRSRFGAVAALAGGLFSDFLGRTADPDELRGAGAMVVGPLLSPTAPTGLLFHRLGKDYADLLDILFTSEVYREALIDRAFVRYLGRAPTPGERDHFLGLVPADRPDVRAVVRPLVSSREYFGQ